MVKRKTKRQTQPEYFFSSIIVEKHTLAINASINHEINNEKQRGSNTKLYDLGARLELYGRCTYPEKSRDEPYHFTIYGSSSQEYEFSRTLNDCHVIENWEKPYPTKKGMSKLVYNVPDGLPGMIQLRQRPEPWHGWLFLPSQTVTDMIVLLSRDVPHYIDLHLLRRERRYHIKGFTLQTSDPNEE
jgi:hypothetical protein